MVALWAEVKRTGVTGREAHGCPCPPIKGRVARQQLLKSERVHVCVCVCVRASCRASVRLVCGNAKSREVPTKPFLPPYSLPQARHGAPRGGESERNDEEEEEELYTWLEGEWGGSW